MSYKTLNVEEDVWEMIDKISSETGIPKKTILRKVAEYLLSDEEALWEILKGRKAKKVKEGVKEEKEVKKEVKEETKGENNNPAIGIGGRKIKI